MKKKLNVLMLGWEFPPFNSGGLGVACKNLAEALVDRGLKVSFLLPWRINAHSQKLKFIFSDDTAMLAEYKPFMSGYITSEEYVKLTPEERLLIDGDLTAKVIRFASNASKVVCHSSFDILHAHDWLTYKAGLTSRLTLNRPLVAHVHSTEFDRCGGNGYGNQFCQVVESEMMHKADAVIAVSDYTKRILQQEYNAPADRIEVVHNGTTFVTGQKDITLNSLTKLKSHGYKIVAYTGRFTLHKGVDYFLRAAKKVLIYQPRTYFVLAGSGEQESHLIDLVSSLGISSNVLFTGFLRGEELQQLYQAADLVVLPSVSEPFGMTPLEALAHKTPVMISKQSGVAEVLNNALRIDFWDVDEMSNQMVSVLRYKSLKTELGENGHIDAKRNTWEKAAEKVAKIYSKLCPQSAYT